MIKKLVIITLLAVGGYLLYEQLIKGSQSERVVSPSERALEEN